MTPEEKVDQIRKNEPNVNYDDFLKAKINDGYGNLDGYLNKQSDETKQALIQYAKDRDPNKASEYAIYKPAEGSTDQDLANGTYAPIVDYAGKQNSDGGWQFDRYNTLVGYDGKRANDAPDFITMDKDGNITVNATSVFLGSERGKNAFENVFGTPDNPKHFNSSNVAQYNQQFSDAYNNAQKDGKLADQVKQIRQVENLAAQSILGAETQGQNLNDEQKMAKLDNIKHSGRMLYQNYDDILEQGGKILEDFKANKDKDDYKLTYNKINADGSVTTKEIGLTVGDLKKASTNGEFDRALNNILITQNGKNTTLNDQVKQDNKNIEKDKVYTDGSAFFAGNKLGLKDGEQSVAMAGLLLNLREKLQEDYTKGTYKYDNYLLGNRDIQQTNVALSDAGNTTLDYVGSAVTGVGGTLAAIGAASAVGAAAGSVVPVGGTLLGGIIGAVGGITATLLFGSQAQETSDNLLGRNNRDNATGLKNRDLNRLNTDAAKAYQNKGDITRNGVESLSTFLGVAIPAGVEMVATHKAGSAVDDAGKALGTFVASFSRNATTVGLSDALAISKITSRGLSVAGKSSDAIEKTIEKMSKSALSISDDALKSQADDIIKHAEEIGKTTASLEAIGSKTAVSAERVSLEATRATQLELYNKALNATLRGESVVAKNLTNLGKAINNLSAPARASVAGFIDSSVSKIGSSEFVTNTIESLGRLGNKIQPVLGNLSTPYNFVKNMFTERLIDRSIGWLSGVMKSALPSIKAAQAKVIESLAKNGVVKSADTAMGLASKFAKNTGLYLSKELNHIANWGAKQLLPRVAMDMVSDMAKANAHYSNTDTGYRSMFSRTPQEYFDNMTQAVLNAPRAFDTDGKVDTAQRMMYLLGTFSTLSQTGTFRLISDSVAGAKLNALFAQHIATRSGKLFRNTKLGKMYSKHFGTDGDRNGITDFVANTYINSKNATPEQYRIYRSIADNPEGQAEATVKVQLQRLGFEDKAKETIQFLKDNGLFQETKLQKEVQNFTKKDYDKLSAKDKKAYTPQYAQDGTVTYTSEVQGFMKPEVAVKQNLMSQLEVLKDTKGDQQLAITKATIERRLEKMGGVTDVDRELYKHIHELNKISNEVGVSVGVITPNKFVNTNIKGSVYENYNSIYYNQPTKKVYGSKLEEIDPLEYGSIGKGKQKEINADYISQHAIDPITAVLQKNIYTVGATKNLIIQRFQFAKNFADNTGKYYSFDELSEFLGTHAKSVQRANKTVLSFLGDRLDSRIKYQKMIQEATDEFTDAKTFVDKINKVADTIKEDADNLAKYNDELKARDLYAVFEDYKGTNVLKDDLTQHLDLRINEINETLDSLSKFLNEHKEFNEYIKNAQDNLYNSSVEVKNAKLDKSTAEKLAKEFSNKFSAKTVELSNEILAIRQRLRDFYDEETVKVAPDLPRYENSLSSEKAQEKFANISLVSDPDKAIARISNDELTGAIRELQTIYGGDWDKIYAVLNTSEFQHGLMAQINKAVNPFSVPKELNFNYNKLETATKDTIVKLLESTDSFKPQTVFDPVKYKSNTDGFRTLADDNEIASLRVAKQIAMNEVVNVSAELSRLKNNKIDKKEPRKLIRASKRANNIIATSDKVRSELRLLHNDSVIAYNQGIDRINKKYGTELKKAPNSEDVETKLGLKSIYEEMNETQIEAGYRALEDIDARLKELKAKEYPTREFAFSNAETRVKEIADEYAKTLDIDKATAEYNKLVADAKKEIRKHQSDINKAVPVNDEVVVATRNAIKAISGISHTELSRQLYIRELANKIYDESGFGKIDISDAFMKSRRYVEDSEAYARRLAREFEIAREDTPAKVKEKVKSLEMPEVGDKNIAKKNKKLEQAAAEYNTASELESSVYNNINTRKNPYVAFDDGDGEQAIVTINNELKGDIIDAVADGRISQENANFINKFINNKFSNSIQNIFRNFVTGGFNLTGANIPRNAFRDMWSSYMANGTVGAFDNFSPTGLIKAFGGDAPNEVNTLWKELMRQTTVENTIANTMKTKDFLKTLGFKKVSKWANIRDILESPMNFTERLGRQANFDSAYNQAIKKGMSELDAIEYARAVGLNATADFGKKLGITRKFLRTASYLNATFAGSRSMKLMMTTDPVGATSRIAMAIAYTTALAANNQRTPEQREKWDRLPPYIKYSGLTFISEDGKNVDYIPLPNEFQFVLSVGDMMTYWQRNNQYKSQVHSNVLAGLTQLVSPFDLTGFFRDDKLEADPLKGASRLAGQFLPQPARILYSTLTGKDLYFGDNIYKGSGKLGDWVMSSLGYTPDTEEDKQLASRKIYGALAGLIGNASADVLIGGINTLNETGDFLGGAGRSASSTLGKVFQRDGDFANQTFWELYNNRAEEKKALMERVEKIQKSAVGKTEVQKKEAEKQITDLLADFTNKVKNDLVWWNKRFSESEIKKGDQWGDSDKMNAKVAKIIELLNYEPATDDKTRQAMGKYDAVQRFSNFGVNAMNDQNYKAMPVLKIEQNPNVQRQLAQNELQAFMDSQKSDLQDIFEQARDKSLSRAKRDAIVNDYLDKVIKPKINEIVGKYGYDNTANQKEFAKLVERVPLNSKDYKAYKDKVIEALVKKSDYHELSRAGFGISNGAYSDWQRIQSTGIIDKTLKDIQTGAISRKDAIKFTYLPIVKQLTAKYGKDAGIEITKDFAKKLYVDEGEIKDIIGNSQQANQQTDAIARQMINKAKEVAKYNSGYAKSILAKVKHEADKKRLFLSSEDYKAISQNL